MCGIFAVFFTPQSTTTCNNITYKKAFDLLKKRGPEQEVFKVFNDKIFGFQRLSINDLSTAGEQPMNTENTTIMCNGEIFNYKDLINKYNIKRKSNSDCEVLLHLYENGLFNVRELNGDFALLIEDNRKNIVMLCRDRVGVRPLFYGFTELNDFVVSSEIKAMSFCETIHHVPPGTIVTFNKETRNMNIERYYDVFSTLTVSQNINDIKSILIKSTKLRLLSDRPIGCLLSGGLDSSIITAILCKLLGPKNVRTYSIGMENSLDLHYARKVADFLGTTHTEVTFTPEEGINAIPEVIYALESYDITTVRASVGMYLLGKYISENTEDKVIFSGEGSDELLCGYLYFHYAPSHDEGHKESLRLISEMYKYDVLRADRCISSHGLELRVPFLDKNMIDFCTSIHGGLKLPHNGMEKKLLRDQFVGYLPDEVLYRRKDGFSDGVSSRGKYWYEYIQDFVRSKIETTEDGLSKEAFYYKTIYNNFFPYYPKPIDYYWLPKWIKNCDPSNPSGRILDVFYI